RGHHAGGLLRRDRRGAGGRRRRAGDGDAGDGGTGRRAVRAGRRRRGGGPMIVESAPSTRREPLELRLDDQDGDPRPGAVVTVEQPRHAFALGCIAFDLPESPEDGDGQDHTSLCHGLFTMAILPFYWLLFERTPGTTDVPRVRR